MRLPPLPVYYILIAGTWIADLLVSPLVQVYYLRDGNLSMLQLAMVGAILAATQFVFEIPTGLVADSYSRRLSIIIGVLLTGVSYVIEGSIPRFEVFVITAMILGVGNTFISGAATAWIADELGEDDISPVLLRAMRIGQLFGLAAIVLSGLLGNLSWIADCRRRRRHDRAFDRVVDLHAGAKLQAGAARVAINLSQPAQNCAKWPVAVACDAGVVAIVGRLSNLWLA